MIHGVDTWSANSHVWEAKQRPAFSCFSHAWRVPRIACVRTVDCNQRLFRKDLFKKIWPESMEKQRRWPRIQAKWKLLTFVAVLSWVTLNRCRIISLRIASRFFQYQVSFIEIIWNFYFDEKCVLSDWKKIELKAFRICTWPLIETISAGIPNRGMEIATKCSLL